jgi:exodeoxyribonuclease V beta subunit
MNDAAMNDAAMNDAAKDDGGKHDAAMNDGVITRYRKPIELRHLGRRHAMVEASAGTGKTYVLEHLVVDLLLRAGATLDQILVVTFTEKATIELTHRVRQKIAELSELRPDDPRAAGAEVPDDECWLLDAAARERLRRALLGFDRANILTIHAFCQRVLIENAFLQGRLFDEKTIDETEAFSAAFVATLRRDVRPDSGAAILIEAWRRTGTSLDRLRKVLFDTHKKLACIYPPRAGVLRPAPTFEVAMVRRAAAAWPVLDDDDERLKQSLKRSGIHGTTVRWLLPRLRAVSEAVANDADGPAALLAALERLERSIPASKKKDGAFLSIHKDLAEARPGDPLPAGLRQAALALDAAVCPLSAALVNQLLPLVRARLERRKRGEGLFDFQDMLTLVARSLEADHPRSDALVAALRARYRYALVDEFQDTDETQWQIFRRLFFEDGAPGVLTLVGDPKQAIYSFRGADVHTYLRARRAVEAIQETLFLTASYRATPSLIAAQNALLDQDDPAPFFRAAGQIKYDHPVSCGQPNLALVDARGSEQPPVVVLDVQRSDSAPSARLRFWEIKPALLDRIGAEIATLLSDGNEDQGARGAQGARGGRLFLRRPDGRRAAIGARDIFVLTRTLRESREVGEALRARRIPFAYFKQERLFETIEAQAVLDLLRALADPQDHSARFCAFITPFFGLTLLDLAACDDLPPDHPLLRRLHDWHALGEQGDIDQLFARILDESGVVSRDLFNHGATGRASERALTNYLHLFELLQQEVVRSPCTLRELAQRLGGYIAGTRRPPDPNSEVQRLETDADAVQIMTIHQSKGLEASVVFVYGATWPWGGGGDVRMFHDETGHRAVRVGRPPDAEDALFKEEQNDEERRVLYVALTRARARLYLPRYPTKAVCDLRGAYSFVNDRLHALLGGITSDEIRGLLCVQAVPCPHAVATARGDSAVARAVADWRPPPALLAATAVDPTFREAATGRAGFMVTSYSAVRQFHGRFVPAESVDAADIDIDIDADASADLGTITDLVTAPAGTPRDADGAQADVATSGARALAAVNELPRGRLSGSFLHEIIEHLPLETLVQAPAFDDWRAVPEVARLFERMRRRHDRHPAHVEHAQRLVHAALTVPVRLGDRTLLTGLGAAGHPTREMEFLYPIPAPDHPVFHPVGEAGSGADGGRGAALDGDAPPWRIERGVVKGFIDYLFEHEGRVYVCDWKSDSLPAWDNDALSAHCETSYAVQAELYTLATVRLLDLTNAEQFERRFGGVLYCFLRGMRAGDPSAGVFFRRPRWSEILGWQRAMLQPTYWGRP